MENQKIEIGAKEELQKMILGRKFQNKEIFAMGSVLNVAILDDILRKSNMTIKAIVDNNSQKTGFHTYNGRIYEIISADSFFSNRNKNTVLIIYSIRFWCEMKEQMIRNGLKEFIDFYVLESLTLTKKKQYIWKGYYLLKDIRKEYGEDAYILGFYGPIGDNYLFSLFYKQFLKENHIENFVCLGTSVTKKISKLFGFSRFKMLEREEFLSLEYLYMFLGNDLKGIKFLQIWEFAFHFNRNRIRFDQRFTFIDTYRDYVYHLQDNREPILPVFCTNIKKIKNSFKRMGLEKGNTIIISPYAYSIQKQPSREFWIELSEQLVKMGKRVAVNICPEVEENFIPSSQVLEFAIEDSVPYLEYAGGFIGMRSGFCDVISSASCKKLLLYPKEDLTTIDYDRHRADKAFGGLREMGLTDQATELEFVMEDSAQYWHGFVELVIEEWKKIKP